MTAITDTRIKLTSPLREIDPLVLHCPKLAHPVWMKAQSAWFDSVARKQRLGRHIDGYIANHTESRLLIITWNSRNKSSLLEDQLSDCCLPHTTLGRGIGSKWKNIDKIRLTYQFLRDVNADEFPYVMGIDGDDAMLLASPQDILKRYKEISQRWESHREQLLFGAERNHYPKCKTTRGFASWQEEDAKLDNEMPWCHLNSGTFIGPTGMARSWFEMASDQSPATRTPESDQGVWKRLVAQPVAEFGTTEPVQIDRKFQLFATVTKYDPDDAVTVAN